MGNNFKNSSKATGQSYPSAISSSNQERATYSNAIEIASTSVPKGGGAIKAITRYKNNTGPTYTLLKIIPNKLKITIASGAPVHESEHSYFPSPRFYQTQYCAKKLKNK